MEKNNTNYKLEDLIIINSFNEFIHVINTDFKILLANNACIKQTSQLGFGTDIIGKKLTNVYPFLKNNSFKEYNKVFTSGKELITYEKNIFNNIEFLSETKKTPVFDNGKVIRVITTIKDISKKIQVEQELKIAKTKAEESEKRFLDILI